MSYQEWELREKRRKSWFDFLLSFLAVILAFSLTPTGQKVWAQLYRISEFEGPSQQAPLMLHVLDVGKADALLIECEGETALLDGGTYPKGDTVVDYLARIGVEQLDYMIASHPDSDHIGGLAQVLEEIPVGELILSSWPDAICQTPEYRNLLEAAERRQVPQTIVNPGDTFSLAGAEVQVLGPLKRYELSNDCSQVLRLDYAGFSALFCGDIEYEAEKDLVKSGANLDVDLLKVSHHGSANSSSQRFLEAVSPKYAVISVGPDSSNLPRAETLARLEEVGAEIFRTDLEGNMVFSWDGEMLSVWTTEQSNHLIEHTIQNTIEHWKG